MSHCDQVFCGSKGGQKFVSHHQLETVSIDDVPAISEALSTCGNGGTIIIPANETFMIRSPLDFSNCSACDFQLEGTLKLSDDLVYWERKIAFLINKCFWSNLSVFNWSRTYRWKWTKILGLFCSE